MADWGSWVQTVVSGSIGGALTGTIAFFTTRSNQKSAAEAAAKDRAHQLTLKNREVNAKRDSEALARSVDVITECVSEITMIDSMYLTPMDNYITIYDSGFDELDALQPYFSSDQGSGGLDKDVSSEKRRNVNAANNYLLKRQGAVYERYDALYREVEPKLAQLDLLLTRATLLTPPLVASKVTAFQNQLALIQTGLRDRIIDEEGRENLDLASFRAAKRDLIDVARTWIAGDGLSSNDEPEG